MNEGNYFLMFFVVVDPQLTADISFKTLGALIFTWINNPFHGRLRDQTNWLDSNFHYGKITKLTFQALALLSVSSSYFANARYIIWFNVVPNSNLSGLRFFMCCICMRMNVAFTFKWYGNIWKKKSCYPQGIWIGSPLSEPNRFIYHFS